jgi:hypothetical protein
MELTVDQKNYYARLNDILSRVQTKAITEYTHEDAFQYALVRVSTNLTGGWFRKFSADNFSDIYDRYDKGYGMKGLNNLDKLRPYKA